MHFNRRNHNMRLVTFLQGIDSFILSRNYRALEKLADGGANSECVRAWNVDCVI